MEESKALTDSRKPDYACINGHKATEESSAIKNGSDFEEGEVSEDLEERRKVQLRAQNYRLVARLPAYCRVNPNLPISRANSQLSIVRGIEQLTQDERLAPSQPNSQKEDREGDSPKLRLGDFEKIEKIGQGTFGKVYKAQYKDPGTGETKFFALKKLNMLMDEMSDQGFPLTALREIKYLSTLRHENIVAIKQVIHAKPSAKNKMRGSYFLLFDYLNYDLTGMTDKKVKFTVPQLKCIMKQLLQGLVYLHEKKNIAHRDIKGANILLNRAGQVQIADFGLARILYPGNQNKMYTTKVVTLWYRAPELLLGFRNYNFGVDIWSMACVFAEIVTGQVLFRAGQEAEACNQIFSICGSPTEETMPGCTRLRNYPQLVQDQTHIRRLGGHLKIQMMKGHLLTGFGEDMSVEQAVGEHWFDLIDKMLCLDPNKRLRASQALQHPFFTDQSQLQACEPADLPVKTLEEDHHEFITKAERNKKKDFRKMFTFRHNLDLHNYNQDQSNSSYQDRRFPAPLSETHSSLWKATHITTASALTQAPFSSAKTLSSSSAQPYQSKYSSANEKPLQQQPQGQAQLPTGYQKPLPPIHSRNAGKLVKPSDGPTSSSWPSQGANPPHYSHSSISGNKPYQGSAARPKPSGEYHSSGAGDPAGTSYLNELKTTSAAPRQSVSIEKGGSNADHQMDKNELKSAKIGDKRPSEAFYSGSRAGERQSAPYYYDKSGPSRSRDGDYQHHGYNDGWKDQNYYSSSREPGAGGRGPPPRSSESRYDERDGRRGRFEYSESRSAERDHSMRHSQSAVSSHSRINSVEKEQGGFEAGKRVPEPQYYSGSREKRKPHDGKYSTSSGRRMRRSRSRSRSRSPPGGYRGEGKIKGSPRGASIGQERLQKSPPRNRGIAKRSEDSRSRSKPADERAPQVEQKSDITPAKAAETKESDKAAKASNVISQALRQAGQPDDKANQAAPSDDQRPAKKSESSVPASNPAPSSTTTHQHNRPPLENRDERFSRPPPSRPPRRVPSTERFYGGPQHSYSRDYGREQSGWGSNSGSYGHGEGQSRFNPRRGGGGPYSGSSRGGHGGMGSNPSHSDIDKSRSNYYHRDRSFKDDRRTAQYDEAGRGPAPPRGRMGADHHHYGGNGPAPYHGNDHHYGSHGHHRAPNSGGRNERYESSSHSRPAQRPRNSSAAFGSGGFQGSSNAR